MTVPTSEFFSNIPVAGVYTDTNYDVWFKIDTKSAYRLSDGQANIDVPPGNSFLYYPNASVVL